MRHVIRTLASVTLAFALLAGANAIEAAPKPIGNPGTPSFVFGGCDTSFAVTGVTLAATTATKLPATALANRQSILIYNADSATVWLGPSTVTNSGATQGIPLLANSSITLAIGPDVTVYGYDVAGETTNIVVAECS